MSGFLTIPELQPVLEPSLFQHIATQTLTLVNVVLPADGRVNIHVIIGGVFVL